MNNIETLTSKKAYEIVNKINKSSNKTKLKNLIDKSLGVLSNNGVYAYYVYIVSQKSEEATELFLDNLKEIFDVIDNYDPSDKENYFQNTSQDIHKLLFLKQLLEKTLIYARYHAKALGD
ncbi:hypothetical protein GWK41_02730 [Persephonella atlantica]|uniref:CRISPR type III-B/RAMP module-associated protein Cmr5 n=1 Tax=Persephonella atlantica TaxID=2699429 RepID=A0ABS1GGC4_9AQUI|nr:hypothetical protein [Persephonella atlantica]MBK3331981.1 hypothetical protein [Persephonella atlantica]